MPRILSTSVHTNLSRDRAEAAVSIVTEFETEKPLAARVAAEITQSDLPVTSVEDPIRLFPGGTSLVQSCEILRVQLWWPRGLGAQPLYRLRLTLASEWGETLDRCDLDFGVRQIDAAPEREEGSTALPESLRVNGERFPVEARAWEPGGSLERLDRAREEGCRLLRVVGGVERDEFFDRCDRLGLLVWQGLPSPTADAGMTIARLRHHPSLAIWSAEPSIGPEALRELQELVETEDPQRLWVVAPGAPSMCVAAEAAVGEAEFRAKVWLHNPGPERSLLNVVAAISGPGGRELYQENLAAEAPAGADEWVDTLSWRFPPGFAGEFTLSLEVIDEEGETLARAASRHSRSLPPE